MSVVLPVCYTAGTKRFQGGAEMKRTDREEGITAVDTRIGFYKLNYLYLELVFESQKHDKVIAQKLLAAP